MPSAVLTFINTSFSYDTSIEPVLSSVTVHFTNGWTGIVGPNGVGKSTLAKLGAGILVPTDGTIVRTGSSRTAYCEQETAHLPERAHDFFVSGDTYSGKLRSMLGIDDDWADRWNTLSHGERKRLQVGIALWIEPDILVLDEPVNHLDSYTKKLLLSSLLLFDGIGIIVSHEREFLDSLCHACLFMRPGYAVLRRGNFSEGFAEQQMEDDSRERNYTVALEKYHDLRKSAASLKRRENGKTGSLSKRRIAKKDHDAKSKVDAARLTGKDKTGNRKISVLEKRAEALGAEALSLYFRKRTVDGITFHGERAARDTLAKIESQIIPLGPDKRLSIPDLVIFPSDRIAVTGKNGTGKSSLVNLIVPLITITPRQIVYIPQEINAEVWEDVRNRLRFLNSQDMGEVFSAVHRLGSEPDTLLYSDSPSPGEKRKIMLALGLLRKPSLIIMDEPTNHMDIPSIQCIEAALRQFDGALVIVSHDQAFIKNTTVTSWELIEKGTVTELRVVRR